MADSSQAGAAGAYTSVHRVEASDEVRPGAQWCTILLPQEPGAASTPSSQTQL